MIPVTKPYLPPINEFKSYINQIWSRNWLTNNGPLVNKLEKQLGDYFNCPSPVFTTNGTIALQLAIRLISEERSGEIITTPFSYVATTTSILWERCTPRFADIDPNSYNLDPKMVEPLINEHTIAILPTHVYGIPCDVEAFEFISKKYNIPVIYDAAHAFGTKFKGRALINYGCMATLSTHATKLFHTVEGGAIVSKDKQKLQKLRLLRNFGHNGLEIFTGIGINGKNSEFHAAMGLTNLNHITRLIQRRRELCTYYDNHLKGLNLSRPIIPNETEYNYAYYPVSFVDENNALKVYHELEKNAIYPRRYFYPSLSTMDYLLKKDNTPVANSISKRTLCLPLYHDLSFEEIDLIAKTIKQAI